MRRIQVLLILVNAFLIRSTHGQFHQYRTFERGSSYRLPPGVPVTHVPHQSPRYRHYPQGRRESGSGSVGNRYIRGKMRHVNRERSRSDNYGEEGTAGYLGTRTRAHPLQSDSVDTTGPGPSYRRSRTQSANMRVRTRNRYRDSDSGASKYKSSPTKLRNRNRIKAEDDYNSQPVIVMRSRSRYDRRRGQSRNKSQYDRFRNNRRQEYSQDYSKYTHPFDEVDLSRSTTEVVTPTTPTTTSTTLAPFDVTDIKVPISFLRIEYMISFSFLGLMYGLGFLVLFQSLCVPTAKIMVYVVYRILIWAGMDPIQFTTEDVMEQIPPQK